MALLHLLVVLINYTEQIGKERSHPHSIKLYKYQNFHKNLKHKAKIKFYNETVVKYLHGIHKIWDLINLLIGQTNNKTGIPETFKINKVSSNYPQTIANEVCNCS